MVEVIPPLSVLNWVQVTSQSGLIKCPLLAGGLGAEPGTGCLSPTVRKSRHGGCGVGILGAVGVGFRENAEMDEMDVMLVPTGTGRGSVGW